jgi:hypothetical protein
MTWSDDRTIVAVQAAMVFVDIIVTFSAEETNGRSETGADSSLGDIGFIL